LGSQRRQEEEVVVQAHRNKTEAEVQKYKSEAEQAQQALRSLRNAIQQEGMDLSLAPAMISFQRKPAAAKAPSGIDTHADDNGMSALSLSIPVEAQQLLEGIAEDILQKLVAVQKSDDVPNVVRGSVKASFESVIVYFTDQLMSNFKESETGGAKKKVVAPRKREHAHQHRTTCIATADVRRSSATT
jgi:hypothetical protein